MAQSITVTTSFCYSTLSCLSSTVSIRTWCRRYYRSQKQKHVAKKARWRHFQAKHYENYLCTQSHYVVTTRKRLHKSKGTWMHVTTLLIEYRTRKCRRSGTTEPMTNVGIAGDKEAMGTNQVVYSTRTIQSKQPRTMGCGPIQPRTKTAGDWNSRRLIRLRDKRPHDRSFLRCSWPLKHLSVSLLCVVGL